MVIESGQWLPVPPGIYYSLLCKYRWAMNSNTGFNHTITQEKSKFDSGFATWVHMNSNKYMRSITSGKGIKQYFYTQSLKSLSWGLKRARWSFSFLVEKVKPTQKQANKKSTFLVTEWVCLDRNTGGHLFQPPCSSRVPRACYLGLCWGGICIFCIHRSDEHALQRLREVSEVHCPYYKGHKGPYHFLWHIQSQNHGNMEWFGWKGTLKTT